MEKQTIYWNQQSEDICGKCVVRANKSALFTNLSNADIKDISHFTSGVSAGTIIYEQNHTDDYTYTIKSGIIGVYEVDDKSKERIVELLTSGMSTGLESSSNRKYSQTAISLTPASLCKIKLTKSYIDTCKNINLHKSISKQWEEKYNNQVQTKNFAIGSTTERLMKLFKFMAKYTYTENENNFYMLSLKNISSIIDVSVENSSRCLSKMKNNFIYKIEKTRFKYIDA